MLTRIDHKCAECAKSFILAIKPEDYEELCSCPFCAAPLDLPVRTEEEDE